LKRDSVVPEVTIGIEAKSEIVTVENVTAQCLELWRREIVNVICGCSSKAFGSKQCVCSSSRNQRIGTIEVAGKVVCNL